MIFFISITIPISSTSFNHIFLQLLSTLFTLSLTPIYLSVSHYPSFFVFIFKSNSQNITRHVVFMFNLNSNDTYVIFTSCLSDFFLYFSKYKLNVKILCHVIFIYNLNLNKCFMFTSYLSQFTRSFQSKFNE